MATPDLWHVREELLAPGAIIPPGRWGATIAADGPAHRFYAREELLEAVRTPQCVGREGERLGQAPAHRRLGTLCSGGKSQSCRSGL